MPLPSQFLIWVRLGRSTTCGLDLWQRNIKTVFLKAHIRAYGIQGGTAIKNGRGCSILFCERGLGLFSPLRDVSFETPLVLSISHELPLIMFSHYLSQIRDLNKVLVESWFPDKLYHSSRTLLLGNRFCCGRYNFYKRPSFFTYHSR